MRKEVSLGVPSFVSNSFEFYCALNRFRNCTNQSNRCFFVFLVDGKKQIDIFEESPPRPKLKMQIGPVGVSSRYQTKKDREDKPSWDDIDDKRMVYSKDDMKKANGDRRKMPMSPDDRIPLPMDKPKSPPLPPPPEIPLKTAVDKFSFRVKVIEPPIKNRKYLMKSSTCISYF